jgi:hypothetical protein
MLTNGESSHHFDNAQLEACIARFQTHGDTGSLAEIIDLSQQRALTLIRYYNTTCYSTESELLSDVNYKLLRTVAKFRSSKRFRVYVGQSDHRFDFEHTRYGYAQALVAKRRTGRDHRKHAAYEWRNRIARRR